ncbi:MAG: NADH-quinone oxidoreductase subunit NuoG [Candidatus Eisenbacteria bacterium]|nr:NADH-quinone oxidoreductase subunit NuoG [Candidatus Eisenbacteria bacterium]
MSATLHRIFIEGKAYDARAGQNLLQAALALGFDLPYFCWHPALGSVGACRQCAVKQFRDEQDTRGRIVMACMTPVTENARISIADPEAVAFRASVIEWLMTNHPHDCPVCDEGGECHLQDMTQMTGHVYRRHRFRKRTYENQNLGPALTHEMNRCIQCYRCVRYYRDYAGGDDLSALSLRNTTYFGRAWPGTLASPFSGNLAEVCPTGVFTDKSLARHYARKWDLQTAPSICVHCGTGCNTIPGARYGTLRRIRNRYHPDLNGFFLCDRGRYGYEFVNPPLRLAGPPEAGAPSGRIRDDRAGFAAPAKTAGHAPLLSFEALMRPDGGALLEEAARLLAQSKGLAGIGSPRASLEANHALRRLVGPERFCNGMSAQEAALAQMTLAALDDLGAHRGEAGDAGVGQASEATPAVRIASPRDIEESDALLILGEDPLGIAPRLALSARQAALHQAAALAAKLGIDSWSDMFVRLIAAEHSSSLFIASSGETSLDDIARACLRVAPAQVAQAGFETARAIEGASEGECEGKREESGSFARAAAEALGRAERPVVLCAAGWAQREAIAAAVAVVRALVANGRAAKIAIPVAEANTLGVALMDTRGLAHARSLLESGEADTLVVLENDFMRRMRPEDAEWLCSRARAILVLDCVPTTVASHATLILPSAPFSESAGTFVNYEGRLQSHIAALPPTGASRAAWDWLSALADRAHPQASSPPHGPASAGADDAHAGLAGARKSRPSLAAMREELAQSLPRLSAIRKIAAEEAGWAAPPIPRQTERFSGRTAMTAHLNVHEPPPPVDPDEPFSFSMEGFHGTVPARWIPRYWAPGWNSVQAINKFRAEIDGSFAAKEPAWVLPREESGARSDDGPRAGTQDGSPARLPEEFGLLLDREVFGSEELSAMAPVIRARRPEPRVVMSENDARSRGLRDGDWLVVGEVRAPAGATALRWTLAVRIRAHAIEGFVRLPAGYREQPGWEYAQAVTVRRASEDERAHAERAHAERAPGAGGEEGA